MYILKIKNKQAQEKQSQEKKNLMDSRDQGYGEIGEKYVRN